VVQRLKVRDCIDPREWPCSPCAFAQHDLATSREQACSLTAPPNRLASNLHGDRHHSSRRLALTLIEVLLTLAVLSILAAVLIPQLSGDVPERLSAGAQIIAADLDYARSLAVANNSTYRLTFDVSNNKYDLRHTGTNAIFNTLPRSPFRQTDDTADKQTTKLSQLPLPEPGVKLTTVVQMIGTPQAATTIEFNALGGTACASPSVIWLSCGKGNIRRYCSVIVDPVTGLVSIGSTVTSLPSAVSSVIAAESGNVSNSGNAQATGS